MVKKIVVTVGNFLVYKIKAYARIEHLERNYLIGNWTGGKETKYREFVSYPVKRHFVYTGGGGGGGGGSVGSDDAFDFRARRKTNSCEENKFHVMCGVCKEAKEFLLITMG